MQTFVPYDNFADSAKVLDRQRLGKQRVEVLQILNAIIKPEAGWKSHPATKMWAQNPNGLSAYGLAICGEWISRGYHDTCHAKIYSLAKPDSRDLPEWWGDERVHSSHRANLLRKLPEHYGQFGWEEDPNMPYYWPSAIVGTHKAPSQ